METAAPFASKTALLGSVAAGIAGLYLVVSLVRSIYLAFFHPLAKIPGPRFYAGSEIPFVWHTIRGTWPPRLKELHDKYGPVVRYAPYDVSTINAPAWKQIYGHKKAGEPSFEKDQRGRRFKPTKHIIDANHEDHRRQRRLLAHAFSEKALRGQEDVVTKYVNMFIEALHGFAARGEVVDLVRWYNYTTFDLIGDLAFGEPFRCLERGGYHPWVSMIFDSIHIFVYANAFRRIPVLKLMAPLLIPASLAKGAEEHRALSEKTAMKRIEDGNTTREDFISYILKHNDEKGMSKDEIVDNANLLIVAGSETTATILSGTTFQLLKNPQVYTKLVREIRSAFPKEEDITMASVNELDYMIAVFNEGFRMYPPVPIGLARVVPDGGQEIDGYYLPEETSVSIPQWSAYQSEQNWVRPKEFLPERWLGDPKFANDARDVLMPFSHGPRNCIGKNLAYLEMRVILARLLWNFDLEIQPDSHHWNDQKVFLLWQKGALNVKLTKVARA